MLVVVALSCAAFHSSPKLFNSHVSTYHEGQRLPRSPPVHLSAAQEDGSLLFGLPKKTVAEPLGLLLFAQFVLFIGVGAVIPTLPIYGKSIGLSSAANGVVIAAPAIALLLGAQPSGRFADRARKPAMLLGMAIIAASDLGTSFSTELAPLILARLGLGLGRCISESGERGMLADFAGRAPTLRGRSLAAQQSVCALGIAIGAPLGGVVVEEYGARAAFWCVTAAATLTLGLYSLLIETVDAETRTETPTATRPDLLKGGSSSSSNGNAKGKSEGGRGDGGEGMAGRWPELLEDDRWRGLALAEVGGRFGYAAKIASVPVLAASVFSGGAASAGLLLSAAGLSGLVGAPIGGYLTDRQGARFVAIGSGMLSGLSLALVPIALATPAVGADGFAALIVCWGVGASAQGPALTAIGQQLAPEGAEAESLALPRAAGDAAYVFAPFLLGKVTDTFGGSMPGTEVACAGGATLLGVLGLAALSGQGGESKE